MVEGVEIENGLYDPNHAPLVVVLSSKRDFIQYLHAKSDDSSFSRSIYIIGGPKI